MQLNLCDYQKEAIDKLVRNFKDLIYYNQPKTQMVFKAPTGSGKTVVMAGMLEELSKSNDLQSDFVYIWASVNALHIQSYEKLKNLYLPESIFNMITLEQIGSDALSPNTILFCNWESMYKIKKDIDDDNNEIEVFDNKYVRIGETGRNLQEVLTKTRANGTKIILVIDEAHKTYLGKNSQKLVENVIMPDMVIEVSATPVITPSAQDVEEHKATQITIKLDDVVAAGMIKNRTIINNNISGEITTKSADDMILESALKQRDILLQKYKNIGSCIKPLILIQLPDGSKNDDKLHDSIQTKVELFFTAHGIHYENHKLAIWLSDDKRNKELIDIPDSPVEVLIFKQAIATGWDCPRAQILVMLRDIKSITFEIQTVGRILRMPELKHYDDDMLNAAYVFTNMEKTIASDTDAQAFFRTYISRIQNKNDFQNISLPNTYLQRQNRNRLVGNFRAILTETLNQEFDIKESDTKQQRLEKLDAKLQIEQHELTIPILSNVVLSALDDNEHITNEIEKNQTASIKADLPYIQRHFDLLLRALVAPFAPYDSMNTVKSALYSWFKKNGFDDPTMVQRILTCSDETKFDGSQKLFMKIFAKAKEQYGHTAGETRKEEHNIFHIPTEQEFGQNYEECIMNKHILQPYYRLIKNYDSENAFESILDASNKIDWWYRNGTETSKYFAVVYEHKNPRNHNQNEKHAFYPDYIIKFSDGRIGIYDTKSGKTTTDIETQEKLDALDSYITKINHDTKMKLTGGIIDVRGNKNEKTFWLKQNNQSDFSVFDEL